MEPLFIGVIIVTAACIGWLIWQLQRTSALRTRYANEFSTMNKLEAELVRREVPVPELNIQPLSATEQVRYRAEWQQVQEQFVDDPAGAVVDGRNLVEEVLRGRGFPIAADFDSQVANISVAHPRIVQNYRLAREIVARQRSGSASAEELRQAMVLYRELFDDLLEDSENSVTPIERVVARPVERDVVVERDANQRRSIGNPEMRP